LDSRSGIVKTPKIAEEKSMKVKFITCWADTRVYSTQSFHLKQALEKLLGDKIDVVTSNCNCFYTDFSSAFLSMLGHPSGLINEDVEFIRWPHVRNRKCIGLITGISRKTYRKVVEGFRGWEYSKGLQGYDIIHYHQAPDAFGFEELKCLLRSHLGVKKVVTIHSLSPVQKERPKESLHYNEADAIIVNTNNQKKKLVSLGVEERKIHRIPYGASVRPSNGRVREGAVLFGGAYLINVKGFEFIAPALKRLREEGLPIRLTVLGNFNPGHKEWGERIVKENGVEDLVMWKNFSSEEELYEEHQKALFSLIPYTDNAGSFPATISMATGTPIIGTKVMGIEEYVGEGGLIVESKSVDDLARAIRRMVEDRGLRENLSRQARAIAQREYSWDTVARRTFKVYRDMVAIERAA
jgi:glycosyltransferase involved in cell wall biosynthesis